MLHGLSKVFKTLVKTLKDGKTKKVNNSLLNLPSIKYFKTIKKQSIFSFKKVLKSIVKFCTYLLHYCWHLHNMKILKSKYLTIN